MKKINCPYILNGIHFFLDHVRACCSNAHGPILIDNYKGEDINWEELTAKRMELRKNLLNGDIPQCCENCFGIEKFETDNEINTDKTINLVNISHWLHCNSDCVYCIYDFNKEDKADNKIRKAKYYDALPILKQMIDKKILSPDATIYITGGEPTVLDEFDEMLTTLSSYITRPIEVFTSGIKYSESIAKCLEQDKCQLITSVDSGTTETFEKIKGVPCFDKYKETIKKYVNASPSAKERITLKYILVKNINDNIEEVEKWLLLAQELDVKSIRLDVDYRNNSSIIERKIPDHYYEIWNYVEKRAKELDLYLYFTEQTLKFLEKGYIF